MVEAAEEIARPAEVVFAFIRDIDRAERPIALVPVLDKVTAGPVRVGTAYREVVRLAPLLRAEIRSVVSSFESPRVLEYTFTWRLLGLRMEGELSYRLEPLGPSRVRVAQRQTLRPQAVLRAFAGPIGRAFTARVRQRLADVRKVIEGTNPEL